MARWRRSRASSPEQGLADVISGELSAAAAEVGTPLEVAPDPRAAAFFDVDNTVMRGASLFLLARGLYARKFFRTGEIAKFGWQQLRFRVAGSEKPEHIEEIRQSALSFIAGHTVAELSAISEEIFDAELAGRIWPGTHRLAQSHLDEGQRVWLVTATPVEVAGSLAHKHGLTAGLGTLAPHGDCSHPGRTCDQLLHGQAKAAAVRALAVREGLELERCSAYSDSANDIPMLSLVGYPCAVNPDSALRAYAKAHGWRVRDFRKGRRAAKLSGAAAVGAAVGGTAAVVARRMIRTSA